MRAAAGDPVIAWDAHGRAFFGSESSNNIPSITKTFGDVFVARFRNPGGPDAADTKKDGLEYYGTTVVASGSSAPNLLGVFHDKTAIEADRTGGRCDGNVYFSWSRFNGNGANAIYFVRSTDHGVTFSGPMKLSASLKSLQFPDISVTHNGNVYVTFRSSADQYDAAHEWIYMVYDATKPGTEAPTGTTYGTDGRGVGGQAATFFIRYDGATGAHTAPAIIDDRTGPSAGHQVFPDISADGGVLHAMWWDSRNDRCYSVTRPIGNCANRTTVPSLDVYGAVSTDAGTTWTGKTRISDVTSNPNYEQFDNRAVPFAGDYLYVTSLGSFAYTVWTDWRNTVQGTDPRERTEDEDATTADVHQCRTLNTVQTKKGPVSFWSGDLCPHDGGIDQNIYGDLAP